jgi:RNA polymerase sigma factor (sigma-70 family)
MAVGPIALLIQYLRTFAGPSAAAETSDAELLNRFVARRDEAALELLVQRFGPMVLGVCRRVLTDVHDAEDAFQATFFALVCRAHAIRKPASVGSWLYGVAYRTATRARADAARRRARQRRFPKQATADALEEVMRRDLQSVLDDELNRLPAKYREPLVLCYLEGKTNEEAARTLGCPCGTIFTRLARGRDLLRGRLARRGVALSAAAFATALTEEATATVPAALADTTTKSALLFATGKAAARGAVSASAVALAEGVLRAMFLSKLKTVAVIFISVALLSTAGVTLAYHSIVGPDDEKRPDTTTRVDEEKAEPNRAAAPQPPNPGGKSGTLKNNQFTSTGFGCTGGGGFGYGYGSGYGFGSGFGSGSGSGGGTGFGSGSGSGSGFGSGSGGGSGGSFGSCRLAPLTQKSVQRELKLSKEQLRKLKALQTKQQDEMLRLFGELKPDALLQEPDALSRKWEELARSAEKSVAAILTAEQGKRLQEISLQQRRGHALTDPEVVKALRLTEEQRQKIGASEEEAAKEMQNLATKEMQGMMELGSNPLDAQAMLAKMRQGQTSMEKMRKKFEELYKGTGDKLLDLLTKEQKAKWKELTGKPFKSTSN